MHAFDLHFIAAPDKVVAAAFAFDEQHRQEQVARPDSKAGNVFFLETGRFSKKNREAIKREPGNRREASVV
jgi:hypothetical protein